MVYIQKKCEPLDPGNSVLVVALATREGRNEGGFFATVWKRQLAIVVVARTTMIDRAHYSLRKHLADDMDEQ